MIQCRERLRLACKPREPVWIRSKRLRQHFDGDVAVQRLVTSAIDLAHPAGAQLCQDFITSDVTANHLCGGPIIAAHRGVPAATAGATPSPSVTHVSGMDRLTERQSAHANVGPRPQLPPKAVAGISTGCVQRDSSRHVSASSVEFQEACAEKKSRFEEHPYESQ